MKYSSLTDDVLVKLLNAGDTDAFQAVYIKYWNELFRVSKKRLHSDDAAAEVVQDIFVDLWERRENLKIENLDRYLFTAAKYKVIDQIRSSLNRKESSDPIVEDMISYFDEQADNNLAFEDLNSAVEKILEHMPSKTRDIFRMSRLENHSVREISSCLQIPERTVEYHITQSLRILRVHLKDFVTYFFLVSTMFG
ncbi:RNA polymerase sigma-70 factor [Dyadobacter frigoris]|uniref:RNA polymerase sigma-70 factor n=1 Tax=Dyadobacter frigoris TaxID=2576211 RepID=A0A4V6BKE2_9BACT|nr:RNA polymerase sigma-70 factor [Dyadobacter frigoris]TKT87043.1 RNA polymerase sigma-70 factor [Dyadobacter frigoris]GLU52758.1 RNA polymerase sigma-70 factor [Dyadobacter frigoris]